MSPRLLYIFPSTTHPVRNGAQVRANYLLRHLIVDRGWEVDFFCPQGLLQPASWGENMRLLRNIYIPRPLQPERGASERVLRFDHLRQALRGGAVHGLYMDLKTAWRRLKSDNGSKPAADGYELLSYRNRGNGARGSTKKTSPPQKTNHPSPVSQRLDWYGAQYYADAIRELVATHQYDAVLVTYVWMSRPVEWLFGQGARPRLILDTIDVQYVRESRLSQFRDNPDFDLDAEKQLELQLIDQYDLVLTITRNDEQELKSQLPGKQIRTVEIETKVPGASRLTRENYPLRVEEQQYDLIFLGADNEANRLTAQRLIERIVPKLAPLAPELTVAIAGQVSESSEIKALMRHPAVRLMGYVPSTDEFFRQGRVLAAPLDAGGGVKVKVLEAMAHGVPVVTTPIGIEGIQFRDGEHGYVTHSDEEFVRKAASLLREPRTRRAMAFAAQQAIDQTLNAEVVYRDFDQGVEKMFARS